MTRDYLALCVCGHPKHYHLDRLGCVCSCRDYKSKEAE